jgi:hypothetical protein
VPRGDRRHLEQGAVSTRVDVGELARRVLPGDLEPAVLDPVVEPSAAKNELPEPVDERLAPDEGQVFPVADEVETQAAARLRDPPVGGQLDEVGRLLLVQVVALDETELHGRRCDPLLEVERVEAEAIAEKLDDVIVAREVARFWHEERITMARVDTHER